MKTIYRNSIIGLAAVAVIGGALAYYFLFVVGLAPSSSWVAVKEGNVTQEITLSGQVSASKEVDLSFQGSGKIVSKNMTVGRQVSAGQTLASLGDGSQQASLTSAQGSLQQAQANYEKLQAGATAQNLQTYQDAITLAQQNLQNEYAQASNALNTAYTAIFNAYSVAHIIQQNDFPTADPQGIAVQDALADISANMQQAQSASAAASPSALPSTMDGSVTQIISNLNQVFNDLSIIRTQADQGQYYASVSATDKASLDAQKADISAQASSVTALQNTVASDKVSLQAAQDQLQNVKAPPTQADLDAAQAAITSAQGQVAAAETAIGDTVLSAPFSGKIDKDDATVGELVSPGTVVATISNNNLQIETDIPEVNLADVKTGDTANVTLDAFGNNVVFPATVISVDSAPTVVNGISAYGAKLAFTNADSRIETGMTANINVVSDTHDNVLVVPISAVIQQNGNYFVTTQGANGAQTQTEVTIGLQDTNNIEIVSGLTAGEKVLAN